MKNGWNVVMEWRMKGMDRRIAKFLAWAKSFAKMNGNIQWLGEFQQNFL